MGVWVKIRRVSQDENANIAYYQVYGQNYVDVEYYLSIDRNKREIAFYLKNDFSEPIKIIYLDKPSEVLGNIEKISKIVYAKSITQSLKILNEFDKFPEIIDFEA